MLPALHLGATFSAPFSERWLKQQEDSGSRAAELIWLTRCSYCWQIFSCTTSLSRTYKINSQVIPPRKATHCTQ